MRTTIEEIVGRGPSSTETFLASAPDALDAFGTIAVLADFSDLPESVRYLGALMASAVKRAYYAERDSNPQQNFKRALSDANDALAKEAQEGPAQWVGSLRIIIAVVASDTLLLSSTGGCVALLARGGAVTDIPLTSGEGSRPFGALTIGRLEEGDQIAIAARSMLMLHSADMELAADPQRFFSALRRSEGTACLRIIASAASDPRPRLLLPAYLPRAAAALTRTGRPLSALLRRSRERTRSVKLPKLLIPLRLGNGFKRPFLIAGVIAVLSVGIVSFISARGDQEARNGDLRAAGIEAAKSALEQSDAEVILGDTEKALVTLRKGIDTLETHRANGEASPLLEELVARRDALAKMVPAETTVYVNLRGFPLPLNGAQIAVSSTEREENLTVALASPSHAALWIRNAVQLRDGTFLFLPPPFTQGLTAIAAVSDPPFFVAMNPEGIATIRPDERRIVMAEERSGAQSITTLSSIGNEVFGVAPETETIVVFTVSGDGAIQERPWLTRAEPSLRNARDIAILGNDPLVLLPDNTFIRFRNGRRFALYRIEGLGWEGEASAFAVLAGDRLAILDAANARLLITNAEGDIQQQLATPLAATGQDLVAANDNALLLLTDDAIIRVNIPS